MLLKYLLFLNMHLLYLPSEYSSVPRQLESNCSILCVCSQIFERDAILRQLQSLSDCKSIGKRQYNDFTIRFFSYRGRCIAVAVSGKNFLSTSLRLSKLFLLLPNVEKVFFVGIGGSLNPNLKPGDVCIPEKWACHTVGYVYNKTTNKTHAVRYEPELPHYKDFYPTSTEIGVASNDEIVRAHFLACTPSLFTAVQAILPPPHSVHNFDVHCGGIGVSGTMFVDSDKYRQHLSETYNAQVVDMESFPFAAACYEFQKLFCVIRGISDLAGVFNDGNLGNTIDDSRNLAADNAALVFAHILRRIPLSKTNYSKIPLRLIQQYLFPSKNPECTINNVPHSPKVNACFQ